MNGQIKLSSVAQLRNTESHFVSTMLSYVFTLLLLSNAVASKSIIKSLPGFDGNLPFVLETGYIGVGELEEVQLFYYFIESERCPKDDPLVLWLTGGPGCSALSGLIYEIGPLSFDYAKSSGGNKPVFELNPYSWTKIANIIFLDAPVGTGFSYSTTWQGYHVSDTTSTAETYEFLRKWLMDHPKSLTNPLYIAGDSYSGIVVPIIVQEISDGNKLGHQPIMNLNGYVLGNPVTDDEIDTNSVVPFAHLKALISDKLFESFKKNCKGEYLNPNQSNASCMEDILAIKACIGKVFTGQILEPLCKEASPKPKVSKWDPMLLIDDDSDILLLSPHIPRPWCRHYNYVYIYIWANDKTVRDALHIRKGTKKDWKRCNKTLSYLKNVASAVDYHRNLTKKPYRALVYSGDHDMTIPYIGTHEWIESLNLTVKDDWEPWFVDGQVAGYAMLYAYNAYDLTFATVKGGGHTAPEYRPRQCLAMIDRWGTSYTTCALGRKHDNDTYQLVNVFSWQMNGQIKLSSVAQLRNTESHFVSTMLSYVFTLLLLSNAVASKSIIKSLPGFDGKLPFVLETGYIGVGELEEVQLFYYFIESERSPKDDPLMLWLTGGPGCSALSGLIYEIGPLSFDYAKSSGENKPVFELNPYSWTKIANIIFLDAPVGTGFSYSKTWQGYHVSDTTSTAETYEFLRKWLMNHRKFLTNPLYIAGDSYSGIVVPIIVQEISDGNKLGHQPIMNLKGYVLGNPETDDEIDTNSVVPFAHRKALISDKLYESFEKNCKGEYLNPNQSNASCMEDILAIKECIGKVNNPQILEPLCKAASPKPKASKWDPMLLTDDDSDILLLSPHIPRPWCRSYDYVYIYIWANDKTVRDALHIRKGTKKDWKRCNLTLSYVYNFASTVDYHRNLTKKPYRALVYSGDHDMVIPYVGTHEWIESLNLTIKDDWEPWFVDGQVAGYSILYEKNSYDGITYDLTFATVKKLK
ncbi:unnamed protein product [Dovyalis caffra]|uniref:Serine carboxypeptidase-like 18 n=1 Tax=Dovyalis caffra TaxID=77055 RepID=A0AAV1R7Y2_9ROSI|nr:unnamed protein product [Dovyalis caffra]